MPQDNTRGPQPVSSTLLDLLRTSNSTLMPADLSIFWSARATDRTAPAGQNLDDTVARSHLVEQPREPADRVVIYSDGAVIDEQGEILGNLHDEN
jgi:hypothetical protein